MMEAHEDVQLVDSPSQGVVEGVEKLDIAKEVASALDDENSDKTDKFANISPSSSWVTVTKQDTDQDTSSSSAQENTPVASSASTPGSPEQQRIPQAIRAETGGEKAEGGPPTSSDKSAATWQVVDDDEVMESNSGTSVWGWFTTAVGSEIMQTTQKIGKNIMDKTKSSFDTVLTTLDPEMEDYLYTSESITVIATTEQEDILSALRDGFRQIFSHVVVKCHQVDSCIAPLPVGYSAGVKGAQQLISHMRKNKSLEEENVIVSVEELVVELIPGKWFGLTCFCLSDKANNINIDMFSQAIHIPTMYIKEAEAKTPSNYHLRWSGFGVSLNDIMIPSRQDGDIEHTWQFLLTGVTRKHILSGVIKVLAGQYKQQLEAATSIMNKAEVL